MSEGPDKGEPDFGVLKFSPSEISPRLFRVACHKHRLSEGRGLSGSFGNKHPTDKILLALVEKVGVLIGQISD